MSDSLDSFLEGFAHLDPLGYYCTTDYRGVGFSGELRCGNATNEDTCDISFDCKAEIQLKYNLSDFYTTEAAKDVIALIDLLKQQRPTMDVVVYGVSYGTFWVQRMMQIDGGQHR